MNERKPLATTNDWTPAAADSDRSAHDTRPNTPQPAGTLAAAPARIGDRYRILRLLGAGGFGQVFLAQDESLGRQVVVKLPHEPANPRTADAPARGEARVVAQLDHPGIVKVFDVGRLPDGRDYIVCQFIDGTNVADRMRRGRVPPQEVAALVAAIARALDFAHQRGVVHRDVKPANILLDGAGNPFLADFGLALPHEKLGTTGHMAGTPYYMSPEQARGEGHTVSGSSDIFSLGAVLYELLTLRRPFPGNSVSQTLELIRAAPPWPPRQLDAQIPIELERICLKALEKDPARRYGTAGDLAADLERYLTSDPVPPPVVVAPPVVTLPVGPPPRLTPRQRPSSTVPWLVGGGALGAVAVFAATALVWSKWPGEVRNFAERPAANTKAHRDDGPPLVMSPSPQPRPQPVKVTSPPLAEPDVTPEVSPAPLPTPASQISPEDIRRIQEKLRGKGVVPIPGGGFPGVDPPDAVAEGPRPIVGVKEELHLIGHTGPVRCIAFAPRGDLIATGGDDQSVRLWNAKTGENREIIRKFTSVVRCAAFSPDGRHLAFSGDGAGEWSVVVWDVSGKREAARFAWQDDVGGLSRVNAVAFSGDGTHLAAASGPVRVWQWKTKRLTQTFAWQQSYPSQAYAIAFAPGGKTIAVGCHEPGNLAQADTVRLFNYDTGAVGDVLSIPANGVPAPGLTASGAVAYSSGGKILLRAIPSPQALGFVAPRSQLTEWSVGQGHPPATHDLPAGKALAIQFDANGKALVAVGPGEKEAFGLTATLGGPPVPGRVWLWREAGTKAFETGQNGTVVAVAFSPDGTKLATGSDDNSVKVWDVAKLLAAKPAE